MPSEEEIKESVEICVEVKRHVDNATSGFSGFTARQAVAFDRVLAIAQSVLDCKGWPRPKQFRYVNSHKEMNLKTGEISILEENIVYDKYDEGFNKALRLCKLAAAKERLESEEKVKKRGGHK